MDAKWQRRFDSLSGLMKRAIPQSDDEDCGEPVVKKIAMCHQSEPEGDVLIIHAEDDLDEQEEKLAKMKTPNTVGCRKLKINLKKNLSVSGGKKLIFVSKISVSSEDKPLHSRIAHPPSPLWAN